MGELKVGKELGDLLRTNDDRKQQIANLPKIIDLQNSQADYQNNPLTNKTLNEIIISLWDKEKECVTKINNTNDTIKIDELLVQLEKVRELLSMMTRIVMLTNNSNVDLGSYIYKLTKEPYDILGLGLNRKIETLIPDLAKRQLKYVEKQKEKYLSAIKLTQKQPMIINGTVLDNTDEQILLEKLIIGLYDKQMEYMEKLSNEKDKKEEEEIVDRYKEISELIPILGNLSRQSSDTNLEEYIVKLRTKQVVLKKDREEKVEVLAPKDYTYMGRLSDEQIIIRLLREQLHLSEKEINETIREYSLVQAEAGAHDEQGEDNPNSMRQLVRTTVIKEPITGQEAYTNCIPGLQTRLADLQNQLRAAKDGIREAIGPYKKYFQARAKYSALVAQIADLKEVDIITNLGKLIKILEDKQKNYEATDLQEVEEGCKFLNDKAIVTLMIELLEKATDIDIHRLIKSLNLIYNSNSNFDINLANAENISEIISLMKNPKDESSELLRSDYIENVKVMNLCLVLNLQRNGLLNGLIEKQNNEIDIINEVLSSQSKIAKVSLDSIMTHILNCDDLTEQLNMGRIYANRFAHFMEIFLIVLEIKY